MKGGGGCPGPAAALRAGRGQRDGQSRLSAEGEWMKKGTDANEKYDE